MQEYVCTRDTGFTIRNLFSSFFLSFWSPVSLTLSCIAEDKIQLSDVCIKVLSFNGNLRTNETIVKDGFVQKKTNDGRTTWIVQRNEKTIVFKNQRKKRQKRSIKNRLNDLVRSQYKVSEFKKNDSFFLKERIFSNKRNNCNNKYIWKNKFNKQTILLNDWKWTIV